MTEFNGLYKCKNCGADMVFAIGTTDGRSIYLCSNRRNSPKCMPADGWIEKALYQSDEEHMREVMADLKKLFKKKDAP